MFLGQRACVKREGEFVLLISAFKHASSLMVHERLSEGYFTASASVPG